MQFAALLVTCIIMFVIFFLVYYSTDRLLNYYSKTKSPFNYKLALFFGITIVIFYLVFSSISK